MKINNNGNLVISSHDWWKLVDAHNKLVDRVKKLEDKK